MIQIGEEVWDEFWEDDSLPELIAEHVELFANSGVEFAIDPMVYRDLSIRGALQIIAARQDGILVGYCLMRYRNHGHIRDLPIAVEDCYFVSKKVGFCRGKVLLDLILTSFILAKNRGVQRVYFTSDDSIPTEKFLRFAGMKKIWSVFEVELTE